MGSGCLGVPQMRCTASGSQRQSALTLKMDLARVTLPDEVATQDSFELNVVPRTMPGAHLRSNLLRISDGL